MKRLNIMLACAMGMSTSLLVNNMQKAAAAQGKGYNIWATDVSSIEEEEGYDIVMLGPQVSSRFNETVEAVDGAAPVVIIDKNDYGRCDGEAVLRAAEDVLVQK